MTALAPLRTSGHGPAILCLHASGSSARQWEALRLRLDGRYRVHAADLTAHGQAPAWPEGVRPSLGHEVARLLPVLAAEPEGVHLVGHSYGAAVALRLALAVPARVRSLTLFEPVVFNVLFAPLAHRAAGEILGVAGELHAALRAGRAEDAARRFFDYWSGTSAFDAFPPAQRAALAARMPAVMACFDALFDARDTAAGYGSLRMPAMVMTGETSPASGRAATERLAAMLPRARRHYFPRVGHMGPVTHPEAVNRVVELFLDDVMRDRERLAA